VLSANKPPLTASSPGGWDEEILLAQGRAAELIDGHRGGYGAAALEPSPAPRMRFSTII